MNEQKLLAIHAKYLVDFANKHVYSKNELNKFMTCYFGNEVWSWRVIGITPEALLKIKEMDFKIKAHSGITRAHLTPRAEMTDYVFDREIPLTASELLTYWQSTDQTLICAKGQNKKELTASFFPIDNANGELFTTNMMVGFRLKDAEKEILLGLLDSI